MQGAPLPRRVITVSVDDGHPHDQRTGELLARHGLRGTFYVPARNPERPLLGAGGLRQLAASFDIGGHTYHHRPLAGLSHAEARREVLDGKMWMEDVLGRPTYAFCYPRGKVDRSAVAAVREGGYVGARTCQLNRVDAARDPFRWGVSTQAFSHPRSIQVRHALVERNVAGLVGFFGIAGAARDWERHFVRCVAWVAARGGVAHLYLHSWEIAERDEWGKLDRVLATVAGRPDFAYLDNSELFRAASALGRAGGPGPSHS